MIRSIRFSGLLVFSLLIASCSKPAVEVVEISGETMGSYYKVKYVPTADSISKEDAAKKIEGIISGENNIFNHYDANSTLSKFNQKRDTEWMDVGEKFVFVVRMNKMTSESVEGSFDPTVLPLVRAWGFGGDYRGKSEKRIVPDDEIKELLKIVGIDKVEFDEKLGRIRKLDPNVEMEFSASVPGLLADSLSWSMLNEINTKNFLIDVGGEMHINGTNNGNPWKVAIEAPQEGSERVVDRILELSDINLATSGNYRNYIKNGDSRLGHILDAKTGLPAPADILSVTVLDKFGTLNADLWTTALMTIGIRKAYFLAENSGVPAYFIYEVEGPDGKKQVKTRETSAMKAYTNSGSIFEKIQSLLK